MQKPRKRNILIFFRIDGGDGAGFLHCRFLSDMVSEPAPTNHGNLSGFLGDCRFMIRQNHHHLPKSQLTSPTNLQQSDSVPLSHPPQYLKLSQQVKIYRQRKIYLYFPNLHC